MGIAAWTARGVALGVLVALLSTLVTSALVVAFVVRLPADYFLATGGVEQRAFSSPYRRLLYRVWKNLLGFLLVCIGLVMALPGVPGQGLLTMLVGLMLLDVPGKRRLELACVRRPLVLRALNRIRGRFDRPPLEVEEQDPVRR